MKIKILGYQISVFKKRALIKDQPSGMSWSEMKCEIYVAGVKYRRWLQQGQKS